MKLSLLDVLGSNEICSTAQLADLLGTSPEMIEAQLERYAQLGYVKKTVMNGSSKCGGNCGKCKGCGQKKLSVPVVFWEKNSFI